MSEQTEQEPDLIEARRRQEAMVLRAAYDYALAMVGCTRRNADIIVHAPGDRARLQATALEMLASEAERLGAAMLVDAALCSTPALDKVLGPFGRGGAQ